MSFGWTGIFRQGAYQVFRSFVLNERRDVLARIRAINAELVRVGEIRVLYSRSDLSDINSPMSERRVGIDVSPNSSMERLIQAYIVQGGNPFDVSMFLHPDSFQIVETTTAENGTETIVVRETEPYGGIVSPRTADPVTIGLYTGGWLPLWRYPPRKLGNNITYVSESAEMTPVINAAREWVSQEIRTKRNDLEARILKLADLREQLLIERDEILPTAVGGVISDLPYGDDFAVSFSLSTVVNSIDQIFYPLNSDGDYDFAHPRASTSNPTYPVLLEDAPTGEENWTGIG